MQKEFISDRLSCSIVLGIMLAISEAGIKPSYSYALKDIHTDKTSIESINRLENISSESTSKIAKSLFKTAKILVQKAESLFDQGNFQEALKYYQQALTIYRSHSDRLFHHHSSLFPNILGMKKRQQRSLFISKRIITESFYSIFERFYFVGT